MRQGFTLLEQGQWSEAKTFFAAILKDYPQNKTAQICYGRATGLNGNPQEAITLFESLSNDYLHDEEVLLNLAESYLWAKEPKQSIPIYEEILKVTPNNTVANLGLANALSSAFQYEAAKQQIDKTLLLSQDEGVKLSYKFITLAYAHNIKATQPQLAHSYLLTLDQQFPNDTDVLIALGYSALGVKDYDLALDCFQSLEDSNAIASLLGRSTTYLINLKFAKAEKLALEAKSMLGPDDNRNDQLETVLYDIYLAQNARKSVQSQLPKLKPILNHNQLREKYIYHLLLEEKSEKSKLHINKLRDSTLAYALQLRHALDEKDYQEADKLYNNFNPELQSEQAMPLLLNYEKLNSMPAQMLFDHLNDNNGNQANTLLLKWYGKETAKTQPSFCFNQRWAYNDTRSMFGTNSAVLVGVRQRWSRRHQSSAHFGLQAASLLDGNQTNFLFKLFHKYDFSNRHYIKGILERSVLDYNTALLSQNIKDFTYGFEHHAYDGFRWGSFTQFYWKNFSGGNSAIQAFNSLYYMLTSHMTWQIGLNSNFLCFYERNDAYFSPELLVAESIFTKFSNEYVEHQRMKYLLQLSGGYQYLKAERSWQPIIGIHAQVGYSIAPELDIACYYKYANNSSIVNNGYSAYQIGVIANAFLGYKRKIFNQMHALSL